MRIAFVGAGAVGGYFGSALHRAGRDLTFLVRPARAKLLRDEGLTVSEPEATWTITPQVVTSEDIVDSFDAVYLAVKSYGVRGAMGDIVPAIGPSTSTAPGLNGLARISAGTSRG